MLRAIFAPIASIADSRNRRRSLAYPLVTGCGRDALKYYENGHSVVVPAEMRFDVYSRELDRNIPLRWDDTGDALTQGERERVWKEIESHVGRDKLKWKS